MLLGQCQCKALRPIHSCCQLSAQLQHFVKISQCFLFMLGRGSGLHSANQPNACGNRKEKSMSSRGGKSGQLVFMRPSTPRKPLKQATVALLFRGCCYCTSTHSQISGRVGDANAAIILIWGLPVSRRPARAITSHHKFILVLLGDTKEADTEKQSSSGSETSIAVGKTNYGSKG